MEGISGLSLEHLRRYKLEEWLQLILAMTSVAVPQRVRITGRPNNVPHYTVQPCEFMRWNGSGIKSTILIDMSELIDKYTKPTEVVFISVLWCSVELILQLKWSLARRGLRTPGTFFGSYK